MIKASELIKELKNNRFVIIAAAAVLLIAAAFLFYLYGENDTISLSEAETAEKETAAVSGGGNNSRVFVDISGCVKKPGVYEVDSGYRIFQVIEEAGGVTRDADTSVINQAEPVTDGLKIVIPDKDSANVSSDSRSVLSASGQDSGKININTADSKALQEIPGIGPVTAEKIISYREQNGLFRSPEDIKNVSGIGEALFAKIKDSITV